MNESNPVPPILPGQPALATREAAHQPLGSSADEREPITGVIPAFEAILRQPRRVIYQLFQPEQWMLRPSLLLIALLSALIYGFVVGTFSGGTQLWAAPLKIAGGLLLSGLICLPSLYIFACLSGAQARLAHVWGLVTGVLALITIMLIGFAPVAWVFSESTESVTFMGFLHLLFWAIAVYFGLRFLWRGFAHLQARSDGGVQTWMVIFLLVMLQMTAALRPIVGTASTLLPTEKKFFFAHWMDNLEPDHRHPARAR